MLVEWSLAKLRINIQIIWQILVNWGRVNCCGVNAVPGTAHHCTVSRSVSWPMWNVRRTILVDSWLWSLVDECVHDECVHAYISKITGPYGLYAAIHKNLHWIFDNLTLMGSKASKAWGGLVIVYLIFWFFGGGFVIFWPGLDYQKTRVNGPTHCPQCTALLVIVVGDIIQCAASIQKCSLLLYYYAFCWQMFFTFFGVYREGGRYLMIGSSHWKIFSDWLQLVYVHVQ